MPAVGYAIYKQNTSNHLDSRKPSINLKGLAIGNGLIDPIHQLNYADLMYQLGLIDFNGHTEMIKQQNDAIECVKNGDLLCAFNTFDNIHELFENLTGFSHSFNLLKTHRGHSTPLLEFLQQNVTRRALHVGNNPFHIREKKVRKYLKLDRFESVADWVAELLSHYRILVWSGQLDLAIPYAATVTFLRHLNFSAAEEYKTAKRTIWRVDNEIAGYAKQAGNLTEVLVRNAGKHYLPVRKFYSKISR